MSVDVKLDFEEKNNLFLYGYLQGKSPFDWYELDLGAFLDTLFQSWRRFDDCFEEIQSKEYGIWKKQQFEKKKDYSNYSCFRYNPIIFSK